MSGRQTCLSASAAVRLCTVAANALMLKKSVPGNCVAAASQFLLRGRQAQGWAWMRVCWRCSSTPVIPGLCACTNWQYDADVKKIDPAKNVMASAAAPTARTYAGIVPRAKQDAPSMNSQAMAELRRAGSARMLTRNSEAPTRAVRPCRAGRFHRSSGQMVVMDKDVARHPLLRSLLTQEIDVAGR